MLFGSNDAKKTRLPSAEGKARNCIFGARLTQPARRVEWNFKFDSCPWSYSLAFSHIWLIKMRFEASFL
jgi:hypothetical protein